MKPKILNPSLTLASFAVRARPPEFHTSYDQANMKPRSSTLSRLLAVSTSVFITVTAAQAETWNKLTAGPFSWNDTANWTPATIPNGVDGVANMAVNLSANQMVNLNAAITVGSLTIGDTNGGQTATLAPGVGGSLTFDVTAGSANLIRTATGTGATEISSGITLNDDLIVSLASGAANSTMTLSGNIGEGVAGRGITKNSATLTLVLSGTNNYTGDTTINAGTLSVATIGDGGVAGNMGAGTSVALGGGTLLYTGATASTNRNFTTTGDNTINISNGASNLTLSGAISGAGNLRFSGTGAATITGTVTNTGTFHVGSGAGNPTTVSISDGAQLGSGSGSAFLAVQNGGTIRYTGTTATSTTNARNFYTNAGGSTFDITQASGELTIHALTVVNQHIGGTFTKSGAGTLTISSTGNRVFEQAISITGGVLGFVINNAADRVSFTTGTQVTGAAGTTIRVSGPGTLSNTANNGVSTSNLASLDVINGATFDLRAKSMNVDALTGTGTVGNSYNQSINVAQNLTIGAADGSGTFSGSIVGNTNGQDNVSPLFHQCGCGQPDQDRQRHPDPDRGKFLPQYHH